MELGKSKIKPVCNYFVGAEQIMKTKEKKDLGVIIKENLNLEKQINKIFGLSYKMLNTIRVAFQYKDKDMMRYRRLLQRWCQN
ncbi:hypothetical protein E2C01_012861 [Portunus trituberculatus]|uniref:Uncharacterized protein n=1 Tax=Portunus trituberculatus TaxID=210409 RepID=A0A5B7DF78_PORTR|nr:hypothetical protein [Portunus trituberculatus]